MNPTWILVVIMKDGGVELDELQGEAAAFAAYERALEREYADIYLAPARMQAHRVDDSEATHDGINLRHKITPTADSARVSAPSAVAGIFMQIIEERRRQNTTWGGDQHDDEHDAKEWTELVREHVDRSRKIRNDRDAWRARMVVVASLAIAAIESFDRGGRSSV